MIKGRMIWFGKRSRLIWPRPKPTRVPGVSIRPSRIFFFAKAAHRPQSGERQDGAGGKVSGQGSSQCTCRGILVDDRHGRASDGGDRTHQARRPARNQRRGPIGAEVKAGSTEDRGQHDQAAKGQIEEEGRGQCQEDRGEHGAHGSTDESGPHALKVDVGSVPVGGECGERQTGHDQRPRNQSGVDHE